MDSLIKEFQSSLIGTLVGSQERGHGEAQAAVDAADGHLGRLGRSPGDGGQGMGCLREDIRPRLSRPGRLSDHCQSPEVGSGLMTRES